MVKTSPVLFALCIGLMLSNHAFAQSSPSDSGPHSQAELIVGHTAGEFLDKCGNVAASHPDTWGKLVSISCDYYVQGLADGYALGSYRPGRGQSDVCIPSTVTMDELTELVVDEIRQHPDWITRKMKVQYAVAATALDHFPCK